MVAVLFQLSLAILLLQLLILSTLAQPQTLANYPSIRTFNQISTLEAVSAIEEWLSSTTSSSLQTNEDYTNNYFKQQEICTKDWSNALPPLWNEVPSLLSLPIDRTGRRIVHAWDYLERMALYKYLVETVHHCAWGSSYNREEQQAEDHNDRTIINPRSILWGLPLQHGWQFSSGRLFVKDNSTAISRDAWWGDMNYYLSVIPYLAANSAGIAPDVVIVDNNNNDLFCNEESACIDVIKPWKTFFYLLNITADSCSDNLQINNPPAAEQIDFNLTTTMERLLGSLWNAHLHSIHYALPLFQDNMMYLSKPEAEFGKSWSAIVDFIAACHFYCDLVTTDVLQNLLPPRILEDGDQAPFIEDMSRLQNRAVLFINGLNEWNQTSNGVVEAAWDFAMCTAEGRAYGREMITLGVYRPIIFLEDGKELLPIIKDQPKELCWK